MEKKLEVTTKTSNNAERVGQKNLTTIQRMQLERAQTGIIVRNLKADVKNETYEDLERCFQKITTMLNLNNLTVNYIRRLPRPRGDNSREPLAVKVDLGGLGDKIKLFGAMEALVKRKVHLPYQISNEIPNYAMNQYRHLCRVAMEVRRAHPELKTRVGINRGDTEATISVRARTENVFRRIPDEILEAGKNEVARRNKYEAERRRRDREERAHLGPQPMDTGSQPGK